MPESFIFLEALRIFDIKLFDTDFYELIIRLSLNLMVAYSIIHFVYKPTRRDSEYVFTFMMFSPLIFFICALFSKVELSIGFAFGLFAVFSVLRYRTTTIQVKEMTYLFIVMAIAVINALATKKVSYTELLFTNFFILFAAYIFERYSANKGLHMTTVQYEIIENIKPANEELLIKDLKEKLGKDVIRYEIVEVDYLKDTARIRIFYKEFLQ
ncbi:MAG: DUF4956 domain-containing protein [Chitinophagales bacterium]